VTVQSVRLDVGRLQPTSPNGAAHRAVRHLRSARAAHHPGRHPAADPGIGRSAAAARSFRELHQGARRRKPRRPGELPRNGDQAAPRLRPRAAGALAGADRPGGPRGRAGRRQRHPVRFPLRPSRPVRRRRLAARTVPLRRGVRRLQGLWRSPVPPLGRGVAPAGSLYNNLGVIQLRRGATPETGLATYFFTQAADADPGDPTSCSTSGTPMCSRRTRKAPSTGCAKRCAATRPTPRRTRAGGRPPGHGQRRRGARERALAHRLSTQTASSRSRRRPGSCPSPRASSGCGWNSTPRDRCGPSRPSSTPPSASSRISRVPPGAGPPLFEREEDREALVELRRAVYLSPYEAEAHLLIGRIHLRGGRCRRPWTR
jgi:hypothetical protein